MDGQCCQSVGDGKDVQPLRHPERDVMQSGSGFDAESMLLSLGFSPHVDPCHRIPQRFRSPSRVKGIDTSFMLLLVGGDTELPLPTSSRQQQCSSTTVHKLRDHDESLIQDGNSSLQRSVSSQTEDQEVSGESDLSERETLLTIILKSLQLSLEYYCNLLFEFFLPTVAAADINHSQETGTSRKGKEHLSLTFLTDRISEEVRFISHHLRQQPEPHLLLILSQDSVIHRLRNLSRILYTECSRLLHLAHVIMEHELGEKNQFSKHSSSTTWSYL